jgi:tol-pal system protein YbgF
MKLKTVLIPALAVVVLALGGAQAFSQTSLDDPLDDHSAKRLDRMEKVLREIRAIVFQGKETGKPVVVQPAETEGQIQALSDKINDLEQTLTRVNGQNESLVHDLDQSRKDLAQAQAQNRSLSERLDALEKRTGALEAQYQGPPAPPETPTAANDAAVSADPEGDAFAAARRKLIDSDMAGAEAGFQALLAEYPDGPHNAEARYMLGETLFARKDWKDAGDAYIGALKGWPTTTWAPAALLNLSRSFIALGNVKQGCAALDQLALRYPKAPPPVPARAATTRAQAGCPAAKTTK